MLSCCYQLVSVSHMLRGAVICVVDPKQSRLGTGRVASHCLVSLALGITIDKFVSLSEHGFVAALFFSFVCILFSNILSVYYSMWTSYVNVTILQEYSRNGQACASSQSHIKKK